MTSSPLKIGIAGLGTVGINVCRILATDPAAIAGRAGRPVEITAVNARDRAKDRGFDISSYQWADDPVALAQSPDIDVFVELIGGADGIAKQAVEAALRAGKPVVTANKALLAAHGIALARLAQETGAQIGFEAAVAGGIPVIKTVRESLAGNTVKNITGILNGTCNYILTEMTATGRPFADVLKEAQDKGYAEADPAFDIGGQDAAHKLAILATLAFGADVRIEDFHVEGIENVSAEDVSAATELGYVIKLLAIARQTRDGLDLRVHPAMVKKSKRIAHVNDVINAVMIDAAPVGRLVLEGPGAGGGATASAVVADLIDLARGLKQPILAQPLGGIEKKPLKPIASLVSEYYLRLQARDQAGVLASIADVLAEHNISVDTIIQRGVRDHAYDDTDDTVAETASNNASEKGGSAVIIVVTHECTESGMRHAVDALNRLDGLISEPHVIRIAKS